MDYATNVFDSKTRAEKMFADFREGKITEDVKKYMYFRVADRYPVSKSEMPLFYLKSKNGKVFYALKSYMIKGMNSFRQVSFMKMSE